MPTITVKAKPIPTRIRAHRGMLTQISLNRAKFGDQWRPGYQRSVKQSLDRYVQRVATAMRFGMAFPDSATQQHLKDYTALKERWTYRITEAGWKLAGDELQFLNPRERKSADDWRGKDEAPAVLIGGTEAVDLAASESDQRSNEFLLRADFKGIDTWVKTTAEKETQTDAGRLEQVWKDAEASRDPKTGAAWTTRQMSQAIRERGFTQNKARADMLAHTGTIWAMNEGAMQRYVTAGVTTTEWIASLDDVTCPFCLTMHNQVVAVSDAFWPGDSTMSVEKPDGKFVSLKVPSNVEHPPLHPRCRCTVVPVLRTSRVALPLRKPKPPAVTKPTIPPKRPTTKRPDRMTEKEFAAYSKRVGDKIVRQTEKLEDRISKAIEQERHSRNALYTSKLRAEGILASGADTVAAGQQLQGALTALEKATARRIALESKRAQIASRLLKQKNPATINLKMRTRNATLKANVPPVADDIASMINTRTAASPIELDVKFTKASRGLHTHKTIHLHSSAKTGRIAHEIGHEIEDIADVSDAAQEFFKRRTAGKKLVPLKQLAPNHRYGPREMAFADTGFIDPYTAKQYDFKATETVSMGFEHMLTNPMQFFLQDQDHFEFILRIMTGAL